MNKVELESFFGHSKLSTAYHKTILGACTPESWDGSAGGQQVLQTSIDLYFSNSVTYSYPKAVS